MDKLQSVEQLEKILDLAPSGIGLFEIDTSEIIFFNKAYYDILGYSKEEYKDVHEDYVRKHIYDDDVEMKRKSAKEFKETGHANNYEYRIVSKGGIVKWLKMNSTTINVSGHDIAFASFVEITKEKDSIDTLNLILENVGSGLTMSRITNGQETILYANEQFFTIIGVQREVYLNNIEPFNQIMVSKNDYQSLTEIFNDALNKEIIGELTYKIVTPEANEKWINRRVAALKQDTENTYLLVSIMTDVTERIKNEEYLRIEQERFKNVVNEMNTAVFEWNHQTNEFYCSDSYKNYAISTVNNEDILNNRGPLDIVHPVDLPILREFMNQADSGKDKAEVVLRIKLIDGSFNWCRMKGFFYRDENRNPLRTLGVIVNINDVYEKSFMLRHLLNELPGGAAIFNFDGKLHNEYFSEGFAKLSGRTKQEVSEMLKDDNFIKKILYPLDYEPFVKLLIESVNNGKSINTNVRFIRKDGELVWIHLNANILREDINHPVYYCMFTEPTQEKQILRSLLEDAASGICVCEKQTRNVLYVNDAFCSLVHSDRKDVIGNTISNILYLIGKKEMLTQEQINNLTDQYTEFHCSRGNLYFGVKARSINWNGIDSYVVYINDETSEYQKQQQLEKLVNEVPTGIGIFTFSKDIICLDYLNDAYYEMFESNRSVLEQYLGNNVMNAVHHGDHQKIIELSKSLLDGKSKGNVIARIDDGSNGWIYMQISISVVERETQLIKAYASFTNCTDLMKSHEEIKNNQLKEIALLDSISGGTAIYRIKKDGSSVIDYASRGYLDLIGYSEEELKQFNDMSYCVYPGDLDMAHQAVNEALVNGERISVVYRIVTKCGEVIPNRLEATVMPNDHLGKDDAYILYAVHSTISKQEQLTLKEQEYYRMILNMTDIAYFEWDKENGFYASNRFSEYEISNYGYDGLVGKVNDINLIHKDDMPATLYYMRQIEDNKEGKSITVRILMKNGHYQWTEVIAFAKKDTDDSFDKIVGVFRNVDKEWNAQNRKLQDALNSAEMANKEKTAFLSRVSHDMRTPLNGILGLTGFLKEEVKDEKVMQDILQLETSGKFLLELINDTLDMSRIEKGKLELHCGVCIPNDIYNSLIAIAKPNIDKKHINLIINTDEICKDKLFIDASRYQQILMNIIGNAVKFTPEGGTIEITKKVLEDNDCYIKSRISIKDNGIGMDASFIPKIFDAFSQADETKTNTKQGTGLGMAITKRLVDLMGATIEVESELGKGSCFTLTIPFTKATKEQIQAANYHHNNLINDDVLKNKKVLLCEDHALNRQIATRLLIKKGMIVESVENGQLAVDRFKTSNLNEYDVILMDVRMPIMDGLEATRQIRALNRQDACTVPIIAMTGNSFEDDILSVLEAGMNAHLSKPIDINKLFECLCDKLSHQTIYQRKSILIVDDVEVNREVLKSALDNNYLIYEASDGTSALDIIAYHHIDIVITDIMMPKMNGFDLIKTINDNKNNNIGIIANTNFDDLTQRIQLEKMGVIGFMSKPNTQSAIIEQVRLVNKHMAAND